MMFLDEESLLMIQEAGFEPCLVADIEEGDTILINHQLNRKNPLDAKQMPTEMMVSNLRPATYPDHDEDGRVVGTNTIVAFVGTVSRNGLKVHCSYSTRYECWKQTRKN